MLSLHPREREFNRLLTAMALYCALVVLACIYPPIFFFILCAIAAIVIMHFIIALGGFDDAGIVMRKRR
ncbi:MAG TPA: hypothetical protein VMV50_03460 [Candidatus Paceibacterota bacterium]|nr:hypothetical protein [Candidatus Paceibacterota bacterium]